MAHSPHASGAHSPHQNGMQDVNQTAEFFLSNYRLGKTLGIGSFGKVGTPPAYNLVQQDQRLTRTIRRHPVCPQALMLSVFHPRR